MKHARTVSICRCLTSLVAAVVLSSKAEAGAQPAQAPDVSMAVLNVSAPFVDAEFARKLGALVMEQRYAGFSFTADSPTVVDKGDAWWVTFVIKEWPKELEKAKTALSDHFTVQVRKSDAAILAISK